MIHILMCLALCGAPPTLKSERARVAALIKDARAVAKSTGCKEVSQCKAQPIGARSCGGPSEHVVYCAVTTDEKKLAAKAKLATDAEAAMNEKFAVTSICSVESPPGLKLQKDECVGASATFEIQ